MRTYQIQEADMKKKKIILTGAAVAAVVVIGIGAWTLFGRKSSDGSTENVVYVNSVDNLMNPGSGNGAVNRFAGVVETQKQVDIQQSQDKTVKDIYVEVGQEVSKGDPLFSYDTEKSQEDLEKAKLELERIDNNIGNKQNDRSKCTSPCRTECGDTVPAVASRQLLCKNVLAHCNTNLAARKTVSRGYFVHFPQTLRQKE